MPLHHRRAVSRCFKATGDAELRIPSPPPTPQSIMSAEDPTTRFIVSQWRKMKYITLMLIKREAELFIAALEHPGMLNSVYLNL